MRKEKKILALGIAAALLFPSMVNAAAYAPVQNNTILHTDLSAFEQINASGKAEENSQLLFPIEKSAAEVETYTNRKTEYVKPEIYFINKESDRLTDSVTDEVEKNAAITERAMNPDELGYDADSIIVSYKQKNTRKSIEEMCKEHVIANGDDYAEELMGTEDRKIIAINLNDNKTVETAIKEYQAMDGVVYAQPNYIYYTMDEVENQTAYTTETVNTSENMMYEENTAQDTPSYEQWYLDKINATAAWDFVKNNPHQKVRVCVLDTGCEIAHKDLKKNLNIGLSREIFKDTNGNYTYYPLIGEGYYKGIKGVTSGHGTMVTGVLGATAGNNYGIKGVASCYNDDILDIVVLDVFERSDSNNRESADTKTLIEGLNHALSIDAKVVNMSCGRFGKISDDLNFESACNSLYNNNVVIVAAAGNKATSMYVAPSDFESVISVMSTTEKNQKASFSAYGSAKDICAPGTNIATTKELGYTISANGTSFSAPLVTGTVAMMLSVNPRLKPDQIKSILYSTATDLGETGKDDQYANGLLNAGKAVQASPLNVIGVYPVYNETSVSLSCMKEGAASSTKYRWEYCVVGQSQWHLISDWSTSEGCTWYPDANENYVVVCRVSYFGDGITTLQYNWTVSKPQMTARINGTCVTPSGDGMLIGCTANTDKYYTALYIFSYATNSWITGVSVKGSSCWYQADNLPPGNYMAYFCTEVTKNGRKLSTSTFNFSVK